MSNISLGIFEPSKFLRKLSQVKHVPNDITPFTIQALVKVLIKAIPMQNYDSEDMELRHNHVLGIKLLTRFQ